MARRKVLVESTREVYTYVYLHKGAEFALKQAESSEEGNVYTSMNCILLCAFCIEAFLNHIGKGLDLDWNTKERELGRELRKRKVDKLGYIADKLNMSIDRGRRPFQSFGTIFKFRDQLVHGKTKEFPDSGVKHLSDGEYPTLAQAPWEELCTPEDARKLFADTEAIITMLHEAAGYKGPAFGLFDFGVASVTLVAPDPT